MPEWRAPSEREFGGGAGEAVRTARLVLLQRIGQSSAGLRQTFPATGSQPDLRLSSATCLAPSLTAARMCLSETALHTQTIMPSIVNANANDCQ